MSSHALPARASAVIVGGGVMGTSIAFHLAEAGVEGVLLLERDQLASGSTSRAAGGVRAQFSDPVNIEIGRRSLEAFARFGERPGWEIGFHQVGYLFALTEPADVATFERSIALQNSLGVPSRLLEPREVAQRSPLLVVDDVLAGAFCPLDGHATPEAVVQGYASGARTHGAELVTSCDVEGIERDGAQIRAVVTPRGRVETEVVICAAGAWSRALGELAGVHLDVTPLRRQVLFTEAMPDLPPTLPMSIDFSTGFYFHREGGGLLMGVNFDEEPGFKLDYTEDWLPELFAAAERRAPQVLSAGVRGGWAGLYENTPDHNALVGEASGTSRFLYATGFSGHGFLQAPAVGEIVRDLYLGRAPAIDVTALSADRFARGDARPEHNVV